MNLLNKILNILKTHKLFLLITLLFVLTRFFALSGDPHLLDTEEIYYQSSANNFISQGWSSLKDADNIAYFSFMSPFTGVTQKILNAAGPLAGVRYFSILGGFLVGWVLYYIAFLKDNKAFGLIASSVFWLTPVAFYYSTKGIPLPLIIGLALSSLFFLQQGLAKDNRSATITSGILMAATILIQSEAIVFLIGSAFIHYYSNKNHRHQTELFLKTLIIFILVPVTIYRIQLAKFGILSFTQNGFTSQPFHYSQLLQLLALPVIVYSIVGFIRFIKYITSSKNIINLMISRLTEGFQKTSYWNKVKVLFSQKTLKFKLDKKIELTIIYTTMIIPLLVYAIFSEHIYTALFVITPILAIFTALMLSQFKHHVVMIVLVLLIIPWAYSSWLNISHNQLQHVAETLNNLAEEGYPNAKIYTSFDPKVMEFYLGRNVEQFTPEVASYVDKQGELYVIDTQTINQLSLKNPKQFTALNNTLQGFEEYWVHWIDHDIYAYYPFNQNGNTITVYRAINYDEHEFGENSIFDRRDKDPQNRFPFY